MSGLARIAASALVAGLLVEFASFYVTLVNR